MAMPCIVQAVLLGALLIAGATGPVRAAGPIAAGKVTDLRGHAIAGALVRAESWHLVLVRLNQVWEVRRVIDHQHWHAD